MATYNITFEKTNFGSIKVFFSKKAVNYAKTISNVYPHKNGSVFIITNEKGCDYIAKNCPKGIKCQSLDEVL